MNNGFIYLHRSLLDSAVFASEKGLKTWIWLLLKASFKQRHISLRIGKGESIVTIERGQLLFGRFSAEEQTGIDGSTVYKWLKKLEAMEMVTIKSNSHYTVITICKYDEYNTPQAEQVTTTEQPLDSHRTAIEQPLDNHGTHTRKYKKVNNDKKVKEGVNAPAKKSNAINIEYARSYYRQLWRDAKETAPDAFGWVDAIGRTIKDDNLDAVLCMPDPIRLSDVIAWRKQYDVEDLKQILREMENSNLLHKYKSCRLTANNWLKRQSK